MPSTLVLGSDLYLLKIPREPRSLDSHPFFPFMIITPSPSVDDPDKYDDPEFNALIANLSIDDARPSDTPPPRTPSPRPPPYSVTVRTAHTFPYIRPRTRTRTTAPTTPTTPVLYRFSSPMQQGYTSDWSLAGSATQGVHGGHVRNVGSPRKKPRTKKAAYVVFCGRRPGVYRLWSQVEPHVSGVSCCIFRRYTTVEAAEAAFDYAETRSWTRVSDSSIVTAIPALPRPLPESAGDNPLHNTEALDNRWYNVYRGISPGVYCSHLECQLNTVGVCGALHESVVGRAAAFTKYVTATDGGRIKVLAPMYHEHEDPEVDPFL